MNLRIVTGALVLLILAVQARADFTDHDLLRNRLEYCRKAHFYAFDQSPEAKSPSAAQIRKLLDDICIRQTYLKTERFYRDLPIPLASDIHSRARALLDGGNDNLWVRYALHLSLDELCFDPAKSFEELRKIDETFQDRRAPSLLRFIVTSQLLRSPVKSLTLAQSIAIEQAHLDSSSQLISDDRFRVEDRAVIYDILWEEFNETDTSYKARYIAQLDKTPSADPWLHNLMAAIVYDLLYWRARDGVINDANYFERARECAARSTKIAPDESASWSVPVRLEYDDVERRKLLDRALTLQSDRLGAYLNYSNMLRPIWGGSHEQMFQFAIELAAKKRYDTRTPWFLYDVTQTIARDNNEGSRIYTKIETYRALKEMIEGYVAAKKPGKSKTYELSMLAALAYRASLYPEVRMYHEQLGEQVDLLPGYELMIDLNDAFSECALRNSEFEADMNDAKELETKHTIPEAAAKYDALLKRLGPQHPQRAFIESRAYLAHAMADLMAKKMRSMLDPRMWHHPFGTIKASDNKLILLRSEETTKATAITCLFLNNSFDVHMEITSLPNELGKARGFVFKPTVSTLSERESTRFTFDVDTKTVTFSGFKMREPLTVPIDFARWPQMSIDVEQRGRNIKLIIDGKGLEQTFQLDEWIGQGGMRLGLEIPVGSGGLLITKFDVQAK